MIKFGFYDVSPDGQHFVMVERDSFELRPLDLVVVPSWVDEMKARVAASK
jgi:gentisate 1,2-dioxygenase